MNTNGIDQRIVMLIAVGLLAAGLGGGYWLGRRAHAPAADTRETTAPGAGANDAPLGAAQPQTPVEDADEETQTAATDGDAPADGDAGGAEDAAADAAPVAKNTFELHREFNHLREDPGGVQWDFVAKVEEYVQRTRESQERTDIDAMGLLIDCYLMFKETELAMTTLRDYLDRCEAVWGVDEAARRARGKADRLFYKDRDHVSALGIFELVAGRYPDTEHQAYARFMVCKYFQRQRVAGEAIEEYESYVREFPESKYRPQAYKELYTLYFNRGLKDECIRVMNEYMKAYPDDEHAAYGTYQIGMAHYGQGVSHYPQALAQFKRVQTKYPDSKLAKSAAGMIEHINRRMIDSVADELP